MKKLIFTILMLLMFCVPSSGFAQSFSKTDVATVQLLLSGYHGLPERAALENTPNADKIVERLSQRNDFVGDRALMVLGMYWPTRSVMARYKTILNDAATRSGRRHKIISAAAKGFGDAALPLLKPLLADKDVQIRVSTIQSIAAIGTDGAIEILRLAEELESDAFAKKAYKKYARFIR